MSHDISKATETFLTERALNLATCWKIDRIDGETLRFTDFHSPLYLPDDINEYKPASGFSSSAHEANENLTAENLDVVGVITSDDITFNDLAGGLYQDAKITETLVDYRFPFAGGILSNVYWVRRVTYTGETWSIELDGIERWLELRIGIAYDPTCRHNLGSANCGVNLAAYTETAKLVTAVDTQRKKFNVSSLTDADNYFDYGLITWTSGNNIGLKSEVKLWENSGAVFTLQLPTPFDIQVGDELSVYAGCNKTGDNCKDKFSNYVNYGGFPYIPGINKTLQRPSGQ